MTTEKELPGAPSAADAVFARRDTDVVKGAAIVLLLCHHLYMGILPAPMSLFGNSPGVVFATLSKVCVAVFALLSGYGLALSYGRRDRGSLRFTAEHVLGLMKPYWLIYLLFFVLTTFAARDGRTPLEVYGRGLRGTLAALIEFLALRPAFGTGALNQTWWYMEAALVLYLCFPLLYAAVKKAPWLALPLCAVPNVLYWLLGNNVWDTCREIYWFLPFAAGIFLAQRGLLDRFARAAQARPLPALAASFALLLACTFLRAKIGLAFDTFFAVSVILFLRASLCRLRVLGGAVAYAGRYSAGIFLIHSFFYDYLVTRRWFVPLLLSPSFLRRLAALPLLLAVSLAGAIAIAWFQKVSGWNGLFPVGGRPDGARARRKAAAR